MHFIFPDNNTSTDDLVESVSSLKIAAQMLVSLFDNAPYVKYTAECMRLNDTDPGRPTSLRKERFAMPRFPRPCPCRFCAQACSRSGWLLYLLLIYISDSYRRESSKGQAVADLITRLADTTTTAASNLVKLMKGIESSKCCEAHIIPRSS